MKTNLNLEEKVENRNLFKIMKSFSEIGDTKVTVYAANYVIKDYN